MATESNAASAEVNTTTTAAAAAVTTANVVVGGLPTSTKKKFGKNLNKLTAPPTAPVPQGGVKTNAAAKNGLLLLSNKRPSSGMNAATSASLNASNNNGAISSGGGGILSTKATLTSSKPLPNLGLHTEYNPSTHDALMGVVVGAARVESHQQPDAWGVADKHQAVDSVNLASLHLEESKPKPVAAKPSLDKDDSSVNRGHHHHHHNNNNNNWHNDHQEEEQHQHGEFRSSKWDEYGGRNTTPGDKEGKLGGVLVDTDVGNDNQGAYMSRIAKERSERGRGEDEARFLQQKERAAQRLRDLEEKIASKQAATPNGPPEGTLRGSRAQDIVQSTSPRERSSPRKLFDPNDPGKSYSSLTRGCPSVPKQEHEDNQPKVNSSATNDTHVNDPQSLQRNQGLIQLTSYDATDRGMRGAETGPRMLFDPKSGSMIEVSSREESCDKKKKNRRLKKKRSAVEEEFEEARVEPTKGRNSRKDEGSGQVRGRGNPEASAKPKRDNRKGKITVSRRLPRTCGVLFSRDKKGNFVSVDKCEGDLGYGVHSVPGGKIKNSEAYLAYAQSKKQEKSRNGSGQETKDNYKSSFTVSEKSNQPVLDWVKPNEKIELITGVDESPTLQATAREWAPRNPTYSIVEQKTLALSSTGSLDDHDEDGEDEPFGLGFDPTSNMDYMIQSPSLEPSDSLNGVDLTSLSLEPALHTSTKASHNIFAFESGSTWGNTDGTTTNDWGIPSGTSTLGVTPTSFLSLSSGNAWGGFDKTITGDRSSTTGD
ncbi:hypothetical protein IV203_036256 [Nitzschia inconspicua]|uniref:Uncharacterized protein n=1 Tax=Nitzschia inconspicua TaxID=303405 RepID=A0A9K3LHR9_9STRA|nr:hypothetical protein IV203_036256 [Nitzschia inconspicua]